jgi:alpha/beta superfamily hydrolase
MLVNEHGMECNLTLLDTSLCAILVHPYALLGGSQQDHVIQNVKHYFHSKNVSTLTFNLTASYGFAAINSDVSKVVDLSLLMKTKYKIDHIILVGYSYGSIVALEAAIQIDLHSVISISYPSQGKLNLTKFYGFFPSLIKQL